MKKNLTPRQIEERKANILRWNALKNGEVKYTAKEIAAVLIAVNELNGMRRNASDVQLAVSYLNTIAHHNQYNANDSKVSDILYNAFKGNLTATDAATLATFAVEEEIEL